MTDFSPLRTRISGIVLEPTDPGFAAEASGFNLAVQHRTDAVVAAATPGDVAETIAFARAAGLPVRVQSTGHGAEAPIVGGILVTTGRLDGVSVDRDARIATVGAGARWASVVDAAANVGLAPIAGSSTNVGVVGYLLGGGLGPLARSHGFSSDYVRGFTVATGTGVLVEATAEENPELYWALRGGKTGLGIVTEVRVGLVELDALYAGSLVFAEEHIEAVARAWADWTSTAPGEVTTSIAIFRFPDLELIPEPVRGRTVLSLRFAYPGAAAQGERLAAAVRGFAPVYLDMLGELPARDVALIHNDPTDPGPGWATGALLGAIDQDFVTAWLAEFGSAVDTPLMIGELRHLGGAAKTDVPEGSAAGGRPADYSLGMISAPNPALFAEAAPAAASRVYAAVARWLSPELNINLRGVELDGQTGSPWSPQTLARLTEVRAQYDPDRVFA